MARSRTVHIAVTTGFVAILCSAGLIQVGVEVRRGEWPQAFDVFQRPPTQANLRAYEKILEDASWLVKRLRPWMQYAQFALLKDAGEKALVGREGWWFYQPGVKYLTQRPPTIKATDPPNDPLAAIVAFRDQLAARGIHLLVVPAPNKESVYPEMLTIRARHLAGAVCWQTCDLLERLRRAGVEVVDLFDAYQQAKRESAAASPQALYLAQDSHWSPSGASLAAKAVAQRIRERDWAKPGIVEYETRPSSVRRVGDVVRMLQVPQIERHATPEDIPCARVVRRDGGAPYQDDPNSEVLVLGDSFLRIYQQDEPGAAGFIAHLAKELRQPLASIVNDGGASTLVRQELYRKPALLANKKLVIWEFVERDIRFGTEGWQLVPLSPTPAPGPRSAASVNAGGTTTPMSGSMSRSDP